MRVESAGLAFDVDVSGPADGPVALLLHGWPQDRRSWRGVAERLADAGVRSIAVDQRGYSPGARPGDVADYGLDLLAKDALSVASALGHDRFHLVGHDWGAAVAWRVAAAHPDRIASLTAVSVPHLAAYGQALATDADQQQRASYIELLRQPGAAEEALLADDGALLRAIYGDDVSAIDQDAYVERFSVPGALTATLNWYRAMGPEFAATAAVDVPTTFVWGAQDIAIGRYGAERCGDHVTAEYRFVELDAGHWLPDTHPDPLAAAILARLRGGADSPVS